VELVELLEAVPSVQVDIYLEPLEVVLVEKFMLLVVLVVVSLHAIHRLLVELAVEVVNQEQMVLHHQMQLNMNLSVERVVEEEDGGIHHGLVVMEEMVENMEVVLEEEVHQEEMVLLVALEELEEMVLFK
jgi:hypothetical protein